jgi:hypothetical protein
MIAEPIANNTLKQSCQQRYREFSQKTWIKGIVICERSCETGKCPALQDGVLLNGTMQKLTRDLNLVFLEECVEAGAGQL